MSTAAVARSTAAEALSLIGGDWVEGGGQTLPVYDPATGDEFSAVECCTDSAVDAAVSAALAALPAWAGKPATERARLLHRLAALMLERADELAAVITLDNGKTLTDARAELQRAVEHLEAAATAPALVTSYGAQEIATGLDISVVREPVGVCVVIAPFNFPVMTGLIYHAWALACGNTVVLKPSEQAPVATSTFARLYADAGFPPGVMNVVHGGRETVEALLRHPGVAAVSLVGSTATARAVYATAAAHGKRVHTAGGARNFLVVMPDADLQNAAGAIVGSVFGMAGQRCLSSSVLVTVGGPGEALLDDVAARANALVVGSGFDAATEVSPVISSASVERVAGVVDAALRDGATALVDRRDAGPEHGFFVGPTILTGVGAESDAVTTETFGPLLAVLEATDLEHAIALCNASPFGNAACVFTSSGRTAREFGRRADVGNIGVNIGIAAPTAHFAFGGRRGSFFGSVHSQGREAVEFYTDRKSLTVRWP